MEIGSYVSFRLSLKSVDGPAGTETCWAVEEEALTIFGASVSRTSCEMPAKADQKRVLFDMVCLIGR